MITLQLRKIDPDNGHEKFYKIFPYLASFCEQEPPIPFVSKVKNMDKVDGPDADKSAWISFQHRTAPKKMLYWGFD
jgi:hypothetical protein